MKRLVFVLAAVALLAAVYHFARDNHRAFADAPSGQFTISADAQSVLDNQTGLRWERNVTASSMKLTWTSALTRCNTLSLGGFTGWRLPTFKE